MSTMRPIDEQLARIDATRKRPKLVPQPDAKGRPPLRKRPDDFEIIFVEIGRIDCEVFYRAARVTVDRWLDEVGKARLIELRKAFVARQRKLAKAETKAPSPAKVKPQRDRRKISFCLQRHAAQHLRSMRNGGWIISPTGQGDWWIGTKRAAPGVLLDLAVARGFDAKTATIVCSISDENGQFNG